MWWGALLDSPWPQKVKTFLCVRDPSGAEAPKRSDYIVGSSAGFPRASKKRQFYVFEPPGVEGRGRKRDPSGGELCWTPRVSESRAIQRFRAPSGGEAPKRSEWRGALLEGPTTIRNKRSAGLPRASESEAALRFRAPRGGKGPKAIRMVRSSAGLPQASESEDNSTFSSPQGRRGPNAIRIRRSSAGLPRASKHENNFTLSSPPGEARSQSDPNGGELCWIPQGLRM